MIFGLYDVICEKPFCFYENLEEAQRAAIELFRGDIEIRRFSDFKVVNMGPTVNIENQMKFQEVCRYLNEEQRRFLREIRSNPKCQYANTMCVKGPWREVFQLLAENPVFYGYTVTFDSIQVPEFV